MKHLTIYINLCDNSGLQIYSEVEAYKICSNIIDHYCGGGSITSKPIRWSEKTKPTETLEIKVSTDKKYDDLLAVLKICFNQEKLLVKTEKKDLSVE